MMIWSPAGDGVPHVSVTVPSQTALLSDLRHRIAQGEGFAVATMNLDHAVKLRRDPDFLAAYARQTHVTADGRPVVWLSRCAGVPVDLVTGSDLVDPLMRLCAEMGVPVGFVGSTDDVLSVAADRLEARHPGLKVVARIAPAMGFDPDGPAADAVIEELSRADVRVCLLALGAPKQELFAARILQARPAMGVLSIGAGLDFVAGTQRRAPRLVRALAAEWVWRLALSPRRLAARYAACIAILPGLLIRALSQRRLNRQGRAT
ncbi:MAG: WecB/TagA/CpsF family glycosyltransferase [Pseudomonadota bacterium]